MDRLKCKACGSYSMLPMEVAVEDEKEQELLSGEQESRFYTCQVCGDNWLSVKETRVGGDCQITFIHQMGMAPVLKRIAHMQTPVLLIDKTVDDWTYYVDDDEIEESSWREKLDTRRRILKSICTN
jgi:hypothetical protein